MFDFKKYEKEKIKITEKENKKYDWDKMDLTEIEKADEKLNDKINELNKENNILFIHELRNAWRYIYIIIYILDTDVDNICLVDNTNKKNSFYTLNSEELKKIKESISRFEGIFSNIEIPFPPVLDGTIHSIYLSNFKQYRYIECYNLWYFGKEDFTESSVSKATKSQIEYTMKVIEIINCIQSILDDNKINFTILT